jgi:hypothetical protein
VELTLIVLLAVWVLMLHRKIHKTKRANALAMLQVIKVAEGLMDCDAQLEAMIGDVRQEMKGFYKSGSDFIELSLN